jgi:hypothetical protein
MFGFKVKKRANMTFQTFCENSKRYKNAEFLAHLKSIERVLKNAKKVISKTSFEHE